MRCFASFSAWKARSGSTILAPRWARTSSPYLEIAALLDLVFIAGRLAIPQEIYEAASDRRCVGVAPLPVRRVSASRRRLCRSTLLATLWTVGDTRRCSWCPWAPPARFSDVLATLGMDYAFDAARPELGVAGGDLSALPVFVPLALILMRRLPRRRAAAVSLATPPYGLTARLVAAFILAPASAAPAADRQVAAWALGLLLFVSSLLRPRTCC